jgi:hypothetical protein
VQPVFTSCDRLHVNRDCWQMSGRVRLVHVTLMPAVAHKSTLLSLRHA